MRASTSKRCLSARTSKQTYQDTTAMCMNAAYAQHASYDMHRGTARATYNTLLTRGIVVTDNAHHLHRSTDQQGWALANSHERLRAIRLTTYHFNVRSTMQFRRSIRPRLYHVYNATMRAGNYVPAGVHSPFVQLPRSNGGSDSVARALRACEGAVLPPNIFLSTLLH